LRTAQSQTSYILLVKSLTASGLGGSPSGRLVTRLPHPDLAVFYKNTLSPQPPTPAQLRLRPHRLSCHLTTKELLLSLISLSTYSQFSRMSKRKAGDVADEQIQELINQLSDTQLASLRDPEGDVSIAVFGPLLQSILEKYLPDGSSTIYHKPLVKT
jgi:hypothetical protein